MPRTLSDWIGKNDNTKAPPRVRQRIFDRDHGKCHLCGLQIKVPFETWEADHVKALINGGDNSEANLAPAHSHCHIGKTALDVKEKSKVNKVRGKHIGAKQPSSSLAGSKAPKPPMKKQPLPQRNLYGVRP